MGGDSGVEGLLAALLEYPGRIVTREELRSELWPEDTFVDFDHSLNAAIKRLRDALGESADAPVFIETLARRGYRFIAPVNGSSPSNSIPRFAENGVCDDRTYWPGGSVHGGYLGSCGT
jgi:DNA-binding winged helix-turn-helix (wHTH) protein